MEQHLEVENLVIDGMERDELPFVKKKEWERKDKK
jgi:hypothetical protein